MTLREWKETMADRFAGQFTVTASEAIRHDELKDARGDECCPIVVFGADQGGDGWMNGENACADTLGVAYGIEDRDVGLILDVADANYDDSQLDARKLREWMERVLVAGETGEVAS